MSLLVVLANSDPPGRAEGWLIAIGCLLMGAGNVWGVHRMWHQKPNFFDRPRPPFMVFNDAFWRGLGRTYPLVPAWTLLGFAPIALGPVLAEPEMENLLYLIPSLFGVAALVTLWLLSATVLFFNTPKWMVPPHRRAEPGALREWRETRRHRREARPHDEPQQPGDTT